MSGDQQALVLLSPKAQKQIVGTHLKNFGDDRAKQLLLEIVNEGFKYKDIHHGHTKQVYLSIKSSIATIWDEFIRHMVSS